MKEVKAYQCDFCKRKIVKTKKSIIYHEQNCFRNPARKACVTCVNESCLEHILDDNGDIVRPSCYHLRIYIKNNPDCELAKQADTKLIKQNLTFNCPAYYSRERYLQEEELEDQ